MHATQKAAKPGKAMLDDRGGTVPVVSTLSAMFGLAQAKTRDFELEEIARRLEQVKKPSFGFRGGIVWNMLKSLVCLFPLMVLYREVVGKSADLLVCVAATIIMNLILDQIAAKRKRVQEHRRRIATASFHGRCPGCFYRIHDLPREPDGCIRCAECGGAWRADRIGRLNALREPLKRSHAEAPTDDARQDVAPAAHAQVHWSVVPRQTVEDAEGRCVTLLQRDLSDAPSLFRASRDLPRLHALQVAADGRWIRLIYIGLLLAALMGCGYLAIAAFKTGDALWRASVILLALIMLEIALNLVRACSHHWVLFPRTFCRELTRFGRCPSCGEALMEPGHDKEQVVCSWCAAAWAIEAVPRRADESASSELKVERD